ncbi:MAG: single-stranded-DNA-specific exonuclease RecJ [Opitutaceae bacterium]
MRWIYTPFPAADIEVLSKREGVSLVLSELLLRAGMAEAPLAGPFLKPVLAGLSDPFLVPNVPAAAARIERAINGHEKVVVLGDYDVDGVTSTALIVTVLRRFGLEPRFVVPRRAEDGYGLSRSAIDRALEQGRPDLFIALDCGTNSHDEVAYLRGMGTDVIVVDHHRSKERALAEGILINPHVQAESDGADATWRNLCTAGLVFKLMHGLLKLMRQAKHPVAFSLRLSDHLDLVALGTVADLVPLTGENRILARHGLRIMADTRRPGLRALMEVCGLKPDQEIQPVDISYRLGPRINASGRLADAALSVELLVSAESRFCYETARQLDVFNRERQEIERQMTDEAERWVESRFSGDQGIVLFDEKWHPGVVGIVAGRVTRKYNRPCIVLGNEGDLAKGSGRSIDGINLVEVLSGCSEHLHSWGGHPMAVGVSLPKDKVDLFRGQFAAAVRAHSGGDIAEQRLNLSAWLPLDHIRDWLMDELDALHPFGQGNPEPVFGVHAVRFPEPPEIFKEQHFRFWIPDGGGRRLHGVAWKMAGRLPPCGQPLDLAVGLHWNHFNGRKSLQMELVDWRLSQGSDPAGVSL